MFDLLTKILDRGRKGKDAELVTYVEQATELWTAMMMEEHDHDQKCIKNVHDMQDVCDAWLKELLSILKGGSAESGMAGAEAMGDSAELEKLRSDLSREREDAKSKDAEGNVIGPETPPSPIAGPAVARASAGAGAETQATGVAPSAKTANTANTANPQEADLKHRFIHESQALQAASEKEDQIRAGSARRLPTQFEAERLGKDYQKGCSSAIADIGELIQSKDAAKEEIDDGEFKKQDVDIAQADDAHPEVAALRKELQNVQAKLKQETYRRKTYESEVCAPGRFIRLWARFWHMFG